MDVIVQVGGVGEAAEESALRESPGDAQHMSVVVSLPVRECCANVGGLCGAFGPDRRTTFLHRAAGGTGGTAAVMSDPAKLPHEVVAVDGAANALDGEARLGESAWALACLGVLGAEGSFAEPYAMRFQNSRSAAATSRSPSADDTSEAGHIVSHKSR